MLLSGAANVVKTRSTVDTRRPVRGNQRPDCRPAVTLHCTQLTDKTECYFFLKVRLIIIRINNKNNNSNNSLG